MFKWIKGRQNSGYDKLKIFVSKTLKADCYILRFNEGSYIKPHKDDVDDKYEHHRLNIILKNAKIGGEFICENVIYKNWFMNYFRPDIETHSVTEITKGCRYILSIGWLKKKK